MLQTILTVLHTHPARPVSDSERVVADEHVLTSLSELGLALLNEADQG